MPNFRRWFVPGGTYFFTWVTDGRAPFLCEAAARLLLRQCLLDCQQQWPFTIDAIVLLPDHLHSLWTLPPGDDCYPKRIAWIKKEFTKAWLRQGGPEQQVSADRRRDGRRGVWQPKYWEHTIRDEDDFENHLNYLHYNPVKHGFVSRPRDWPWSTFYKWVKLCVYPEDWACDPSRAPDLAGIHHRAGE
jgi:putative transposase